MNSSEKIRVTIASGLSNSLLLGGKVHRRKSNTLDDIIMANVQNLANQPTQVAKGGLAWPPSSPDCIPLD